jgi:hypothetical protein
LEPLPGPKRDHMDCAADWAVAVLVSRFSVNVAPPMERSMVFPAAWQVMMSAPTSDSPSFPVSIPVVGFIRLVSKAMGMMFTGVSEQ